MLLAVFQVALVVEAVHKVEGVWAVLLNLKLAVLNSKSTVRTRRGTVGGWHR